MKHATLIVIALTPLLPFGSFAQATRYQPPRTADGKPSLEGNWTNATLTSLQRPERFKGPTIAAQDIERETSNHPQVVRQRTDDQQDETTTRDGSDLGRGRGYNAFWIDPGMSYNRVRGEYRTSFIVDPPDGQIPLLDSVRAARGDARLRGFDGPEARPLGERCIINSGSAGPPLMTYLYNNNFEFVQSAGHFLIRAEMNNYARIVRIGGTHLPKTIRPIHGDSIGRWEGDTLVVETTNFHPHHANGNIALTEHARVTERFTRYSKDQILYQFTVADPTRYAQAWHGEYSFNATPTLVYEYGCHEGNYALSGVLAGARAQEKTQPAK
jgi:hypothetical protein